MTRLNLYITFLIIFSALSFSGQAQSITLSKDFTSPTSLRYNNDDNYFFVNILPGNCPSIANPECTRLYNPNNSFFAFTANQEGGFSVELEFRDSVEGGISLFVDNEGTYTEIYCTDFNTDLLVIKHIDEVISGKDIIAQLWFPATPDEFSAHLKIKEFAGYGNMKVPAIDISTYTPEQLVQEILISGCVEAQNVTFHGSLESIGYFENGIPGLSFENGIIMSSGRVTDAAGPNNSGSTGTNLHNPGDGDLSNIVGTQTHDAAVLEFDFIPASNTVSFEYVFGSEEYEEFVGQGFNDVFAFFVSGGPEAYSNVNIARIPVVGVPVSINNVNQTDNSAYYVNNDGGLDIQFDGMTVTLTAFLNVTQCETYHMKLAVSDVGDGIYDSGVFLKAGSFNSGASVVLRNYNAWGLVNTVHEGCTNEVVFARSDLSNLSDPMPVVITVEGTAINGTDYSTINTDYTIPGGQESISIDLEAFTDGIPEGAETIILTVFNGCPCSVQTASDTISVLDEIIFTPTLINNGPVCQGDSALLSLSNLPATDTIRIEWSNGVTGPSQIWVHPAVTTTYTANIFYPCSSKSVSTTVTVNPVPNASASNDGPYCVGDPIHLFGTGGVTYRWRGPDSFLNLQQNPVINNSQLVNGGTYQVTVTGANGCKSITSTYVDVNPLPNLELNANTPFCTGDPISFIIDTFPDYYYWGPDSWNSVDSFPIVGNAAETHEGWYYVIVTDTNLCRAIDSVFIEVNPSPVANAWSNSPVCEGTTLLLYSDGGPSYSWTGPAGFTSTDQNPFIAAATPANSGNYTVTVRNIYNCTDSYTISYTVNPTPDAGFTNPGSLCINSSDITLSPVNSGGTWSGTGITNALTGVFSPSTAGAGSHIVTYNLTQNGCIGSHSETITVDAMPVININSAGPFCISDAATNLTTTSPGGLWSGTGITDAVNGTFDPAVAGAGTHTITYSLTNGACNDSDNISVSVYPLVDATITPAGPFCETDIAVTLTAVTPGGTWSGAGITNVSLGTFDPAVANPGIHTITYTVANGGCSDTDTELLTVYLYPDSDWFTIGPFCETNAAVNILPVTSGGTFSGNGITDAANGTFDPAVAGAGTHNITYTRVNGTCISTTTKPVLVYGAVDATISPAGPFCETDPAVILSAADAGGTWSGTGITNASTGSFDPAVAGPGVHTVTYTVSNGNCIDSDNELILVYLNPNADFIASGPYCETDAAVNLVAVNPGGTWSGPGITDAANGTFDPAVAGPGIHDISYTIVNVACTDVVTKPITVNDAVDATITPAGPFCQNQAALSLTAVDPGGAWSGTGITNPATGTFNPAIAGPGTHLITYSIVNGACSDTDTENFVVNLYPNSAINPAGPFCQNAAPVNLTSASAGGTWSGNGITNAATGTFNPSVAGAGNHTITYTIINGACTSVSTTIIHVDASVNATITPVATICVFNPAFNLTAVSSGGTWSGTGITNSATGTFDPTIAGPGIHTITYSVTNGTCSDSDTENINVSANPNPTIFAAGPFCEDAAPVNLTSVTSGGTWSGTGITDAALGTFDPGTAGGGDHIITYVITIGACTNSDTETIHVDADVDATITPAGPFCQFDPAVYLSAVSAGGVWAGTGITNTSTGNFNPSVAGAGIHNITYNIVNGLCSDSDNVNITVNVAPDGTINDPGVFCLTDAPVNLTAATAGGVWSGPGITNAVTGTFDPAAANSGENIISYTISNGFCTTVASISVFVYDNVVDATITSTGPYCVSSGLVTLTAVSAGGTWSGTGIVNPATGSFNPGIAGPGNHLITYNVGSIACFDTDTQLIHVDDSLSAAINPAGPVCQSSAAFNFTAATAGGTWSGTGITNAALGTFNPVVAGSGNHVITYTISQGACTNTDTFTIHVDASVNATITPAGPFCNNQPIQTLTAVSPGGTWSGTGIVNTATGLFHPGVAGGGDHIITYNVSNGTCSASDTEIIHVDAFPNTTISPAGPFCENNAVVNLNAASAGGTWSGTGITNPATGTFDPSVAGGGNHTITYSVTNGACFSSSVRIIQVDDFYDATITPAGPFCNTQPFQNLVAASSGGVWSGIGITDINAGIFNPGVAGPGDFTITYSTVNGLCSDNDNISIHVDQYLNATINPAGPFCQNAAALNLTAANTGGIWSGNGIIVPGAGTFNPSIAGSGNHIISYTITNGACVSSDTETIHVDSVLNATINPAGPFCQNASAINMTAASPGGTWSGTGITNITTGTFNPAVAGPGNHTITYQIVNGMCTSSDTEIVHVDLFPNTTLTAYGPFCETSASVNLAEPSSGGNWSGNGITDPVTGIFNPSIAGEGTHTITYTNINGACTSTGTTNIHIDAAVDATITLAGPFCNSDASVFMTAVSQGGTWSGNGIVNSVTGLFNPAIAGTGTHNIQYTVSNGLCTDTDNISVIVEAAPDATIITSGPFCENDITQVFTAVTTGGVWSGDGIDMAGNFNPAVAGPGSHIITYTITIGSCMSTDQADIMVNNLIDASITSTGPFCIMDSPVQLLSVNTGGVWSGTGVNSGGLFSPALAGIGNHNITYTIVNGECTDSDTRILSVNNNPDATITDVLPVCINNPAFNLVAATAGGTWSGTGITDAVAGTFDPAVAGTGVFTLNYSITISGCSSSDNTDITVNTLPVVTISGLNADYCMNEGAVAIIVSPPGGSLTGDGISGTTFTPSDAGSGAHQIVYTFTDANSCVNNAVVDLIVHDLPVVSIAGIDEYYCFYDSPVNPVLLPVGGTFEGSGVSGISFDPQSAGPGTYELIYHFTDINFCTDTAIVNTTVLDSPEIVFDFTGPSCFGFSDGNITTSVNGGLSPYSYLWSASGSTEPGLDGVNAGMYYLTITDNNSCIKVDSVLVTQPEELTVQITNQINAGCFGYSDGSATAEVAGGTPEYIFLWDNLEASTTALVENLEAGEYSVIVTDLHNCTATASLTISQPDTLSLIFTDIENVVCYSQSNGSVSVEASGGTPSYTAVWNNPGSTSGFSISDLTAGYYTVTVTDSHDCQIIDSTEITQPDSVYIESVINPVICAQQPGSVIITTFGGVSPYEYEWSSGEIVSVLSGKVAGTYLLTITDANNCELNTSVEIGTEGRINAEITQTAFNLCFGDEIAGLVAYSDNAADTSMYLWSDFTTDNTIINLGADEYFVTITDAWGCFGVDSVIVEEPDDLLLTINSDNIKCKGYLTGRASVIAEGGTAPYSPEWQNGDLTFYSNSLPAGEIWVTITDYNGCKDSISTVITEPVSELSISMNIEQISCYGAMDASINSYANGGTPPYFYRWNINGLYLTDPTIRNLDKGEFYLTITDNNNCKADTMVSISEPDPLGALFITGNPTCDGNYDGYIQMAGYGGTIPYSFFFYDEVPVSYFIDSLYEGEYFVTVRDFNNCEFTAGPITLIDDDVDCLHFPAAFSPNGDGYNDEWFIENIQLYPKSVVQIYNRWGQLLYEKKGIDGYWDGTYNGDPVPTGVYIYMIILNNDEETRTGTITLIR